jgi:hypothetical protein
MPPGVEPWLVGEQKVDLINHTNQGESFPTDRGGCDWSDGSELKLSTYVLSKSCERQLSRIF